MKLKKKVNKKPQLVKDFYSERELDYHDFGRVDLFDIEKILNEFLEDCHIASLTYVLVITGTGLVVKPAVEKLLRRHKLVQTFKSAGYFNGQGGAFEVILKS
jgi:DNA-nicking Smr family endonuclease